MKSIAGFASRNVIIKAVSFLREHSPLFDELKQKTREYAQSKDIDYVWVPQIPCEQKIVVYV